MSHLKQVCWMKKGRGAKRNVRDEAGTTWRRECSRVKCRNAHKLTGFLPDCAYDAVCKKGRTMIKSMSEFRDRFHSCIVHMILLPRNQSINCYIVSNMRPY